MTDDSIITALPAVAEIDQALADLAQEQRDFLDAEAADGQRVREQLAAWKAEVAALAAGETPPPKPAPSPYDDARTDKLDGFRADEAQLKRDRKAAIVAHADQVRGIAADRLGKIQDKVTKHRAALETLAREATRVRAEVAEAVAEENAQAGVTPHHRPSPTLTAVDLLNAEPAADLLADLTKEQTLGMSWGNRDSMTAPEPTPEQLQMNRQHAERMRPGPVTARRGY